MIIDMIAYNFIDDLDSSTCFALKKAMMSSSASLFPVSLIPGGSWILSSRVSCEAVADGGIGFACEDSFCSVAEGAVGSWYFSTEVLVVATLLFSHMTRYHSSKSF